MVLASGGLTIQRSGGETVYWTYKDIVRSRDSVSGGPLRLEHGEKNPEVLVIHQSGALAEIRRLDPAVQIPVRRCAGAGWWKIAAIFVSFTGLVVVAVYLVILPMIGEAVADHVPKHWEERIGKAMGEQIESMGGGCRDQEAQSQVLRLVNDLARPLDSGYSFQVIVAADREMNAFAAPGGVVIVNTGLIEKTRTQEHLAAVLAHEITHVVGRHGTRAVMRELTFSIALNYVTGDVNAVAAQMAGNLAGLHYRREDETAADQGAMDLFARLRLEPRAMVSMFEMLGEKTQDLPAAAGYLSTHPSMPERLERIKAWAAKQTYSPSYLRHFTAWPPTTAKCRGL